MSIPSFPHSARRLAALYMYITRSASREHGAACAQRPCCARYVAVPPSLPVCLVVRFPSLLRWQIDSRVLARQPCLSQFPVGGEWAQSRLSSALGQVQKQDDLRL